MDVLQKGNTSIFLMDSDVTMGKEAAWKVLNRLMAALGMGEKPVLWLMAAPSGITLYRWLVKIAREHRNMGLTLASTEIYQFDDYPISRESERFPVTFRHLLEEQLITPLREQAGIEVTWHPLELEGDEKRDQEIIAEYQRELMGVLEDEKTHVTEVKGTGMDGHWGFHGAETPLDMDPALITVPMSAENTHQQMIDWPQYFRTPEDVPQYAVTCNVAMFLKADMIVDVVPQPTKQYAVLAAYGTEDVIPEIPSSAIARHPESTAFITRSAGEALRIFREGREKDRAYTLNGDMLEQLRDLWRDEKNPGQAEESIRTMEEVLRKLGVIS
jgi:glucosamine-6-phosphate deaminase